MADILNLNRGVAQNLQDAGCDSGTVKQFLKLQKDGRTEEELRLLAEHRYLLLQGIHDNQKKLDCLDYLIYKLKREAAG